MRGGLARPARRDGTGSSGGIDSAHASARDAACRNGGQPLEPRRSTARSRPRGGRARPTSRARARPGTSTARSTSSASVGSHDRRASSTRAASVRAHRAAGCRRRASRPPALPASALVVDEVRAMDGRASLAPVAARSPRRCAAGRAISPAAENFSSSCAALRSGKCSTSNGNHSRMQQQPSPSAS